MDTDDWQAPTEAEMKLIEARRERSDKISKLMSTYLLKGYKMLATVCSECETILLQDRQGTKYCVACSELDSDTDKDNPVINEAAAISMAREISSAAGTKTKDFTGAGSPTRLAQGLHGSGDTLHTASPKPQMLLTGPRPFSQPYTLGQVLQDPSESASHNLSPDHQSAPCSVQKLQSGPCKISNESLSTQSPVTSLGTLCEKLEWASKELSHTDRVEYSIQLCQLIKAAAEAIVAVRKTGV
ncbi:unnamed protein product [Lymnaea stagnalis]|uniref:Sjoegren syndrome/scleroderma autoantigen 1 n=1 Tax=Lymnaea stagnalis TaxID=6523 RepID=A0AAV2IJH4_LYMST